MLCVDDRHQWELTLLKGDLPLKTASSVWAKDIDGDGNVEVLVSGCGMYWFRPKTHENGLVIDNDVKQIHGGLHVDDIDGDGLLEVICGENLLSEDANRELVWYKPQEGMKAPWERHMIDTDFPGYSHDLLFDDVDGDGDREIVTLSVYSSTLGIYIYKMKDGDPLRWEKNTVSEGFLTDGLSLGDINGDGILEIVSGPDWYTAPPGGIMAGRWKRGTFAPNFRHMCLTAQADITGTGRPDIIITEAEYPNGRLSWFENRVLEDKEHPWIEHLLGNDFIFSHSLMARDTAGQGTRFMIGEMERGGWEPPYNYEARVILYETNDKGATWEQRLITKGEGTHQAVFADVDGDGIEEIQGESNGKYDDNPRLQMWKRQDKPSAFAGLAHSFVDRDRPKAADGIYEWDINGSGAANLLCGRWWYKYPGWERYTIPEIDQVIGVCDIDRDGSMEIIACKKDALCWMKPIRPEEGAWELHDIVKGLDATPLAVVAVPLSPNGARALIVTFKQGAGVQKFPLILTIPGDPLKAKWYSEALAKISVSGDIALCDITGNGILDVVIGPYWFENKSNGEFAAHRYAPECFEAAGLGILDVNADGRPDIILGENRLDRSKKIAGWSRLAWFENPDTPKAGPWKMHVLDWVRCAFSIGVGDLDGDGMDEIYCGEHDPFYPYRNKSRLIGYRMTPLGFWSKYVIDDRFEHYRGARIFGQGKNKFIASQGSSEELNVNMWKYGNPS